MELPSLVTLAFEPFSITPSETIHPATAPTFETLNTFNISALPR